MDTEQQNKPSFVSISPDLAAKIYAESQLVESFFTENLNSSNYLILTLTKNHVIARSTSENQSDKFFVAEINFDLKF